jgi:hypothetical protein
MHRPFEVAVTHIDWKSHAQAIRHFQATSTTLLVKFLSKWLPVDKKSTVTSQQYILCKNKDFNHTFRRSDPQRCKRRSDVRRERLQRLNYLNTDPALADHHPPLPRFPQYASRRQTMYRLEAIAFWQVVHAMGYTSNIEHSEAEHQGNLHEPRNWLVKSSNRTHMETLL